MVPLLNLLLRERWRRSGLLYGWPARLTALTLLLFVAVGLTPLIGRLIDTASFEQVGVGLNRLGTIWVVTGVLIGKDLTWHTRLDKLTFFPLSFGQLYGSTLVLALLSLPLLLLLCGFEVSFYGRGLRWIGWLVTFAGFFLLVCCVRATISLVRTILYQRHAVRSLLWFFMACAVGLSVALGFDSRAAQLSPGYQLALVLLGINPILHLLIIVAEAALLVCGDCVLQREVAYSGMTGPPSTRISNWSRGRFLSFRSSPSTTLWRISLLGWIRTPKVVLLMISGAVYSFAYIWLARPEGQSVFILYSWMVLVFHSSLRGNLLGVDHKSVWFYFMLPIPLEETIRAKNSSLSLLQMTVVVAVFLPALLRTTPGMTTALEWMAVLSYAYSTILVGEIVGSVLSIRSPQPIERASLYSGGTAAGAFAVPACQALFLIIFVACTFQLSGAITVVLLAGVPVCLWFARSSLLHSWVHNEMTRQRDKILFKLSRNTT